MLDGGLYDKVPIPDLVVGQHSVPLREETVNIRSGAVLVAADTFHIRIKSKNEHSINPQQGVNPIDAICSIVVKLKCLVGIITSVGDFAVITPERIHADPLGFDTVHEAVLVLKVRATAATCDMDLMKTSSVSFFAENKAAGIEKAPAIDIKVSKGTIIDEQQP